jgi:hypothetical protein
MSPGFLVVVFGSTDKVKGACAFVTFIVKINRANATENIIKNLDFLIY